MRNRVGLRYMVSILVLVSIVLTGCEKERPAPTPATLGSTPAAGSATGSQMPEAAQTEVALPGSSGAQATPVPLLSSTSTPPPPKSVESALTTSGSGTTLTDETFVYTVEAGDTLASIARQYDTTVQEILSFNPIVDPDVLTVGQDLRIPGTSSGGSSSASTSDASGVTAATGENSVYAVQSGDTLAAIAQKFGMDLAQLQALNDISDPDQIYVGQELTVSAGDFEEQAVSSERTTYAVQRGDTLFSIAVAHGVTVTALKSANDIADENQIYVGQVLTIP